MKKILALAAAAIVCIGVFAACSGNEGELTTTAAKGEITTSAAAEETSGETVTGEESVTESETAFSAQEETTSAAE